MAYKEHSLVEGFGKILGLRVCGVAVSGWVSLSPFGATRPIWAKSLMATIHFLRMYSRDLNNHQYQQYHFEVCLKYLIL